MTKRNLVSECEEPSIGDTVKICISCGSIFVIIENDTLSCRVCGRRFKIERRKNGFHV